MALVVCCEYAIIYLGKNKKNKPNKSYGPTDEMAQYSNPNIGKNKKNKLNKRISFLQKEQITIIKICHI